MRRRHQNDEGEAADRVGPLSPLTPAPEPTPQKVVEDDIAEESVTLLALELPRRAFAGNITY